jgi:hypothetical protein
MIDVFTAAFWHFRHRAVEGFHWKLCSEGGRELERKANEEGNCLRC